MGTAITTNSPSVPAELSFPNIPAVESQDLHARQLQVDSPHRRLEITRVTTSALRQEILTLGDISKKHYKSDGDSRVAALRHVIEVKEKDSKIGELKERVERLQALSEQSKITVELLNGKDAEIKALKNELLQLGNVECDACRNRAKAEKELHTLKEELGRFHHVEQKPKGFPYREEVNSAAITAEEEQVQPTTKGRNEGSQGGETDDGELSTLRQELDRLRRSEKNSKVAVNLLEQAAKELFFLRDEVVALRQRMARSDAAGTYLMAEDEILSLRAEVMRLRQVEESSLVAADMLEEIMDRSDAAADVLHEMMPHRGEVPETEINSGGD